MKRAGLICSLAILFFSISCGHPTTMVSMSISPSSTSVYGFGAIIPAQFTAYGVFMHPSETRDITKQVSWTSSAPMVATVKDGLVTPAGVACGTTILTATAGKDLIGPGSDQTIMTATATFTVVDPNVDGCHQ